MDGTTSAGILPIVVGVDGSPESVVALRWAKKLAVPLGATIKAVSVWHADMFFGPFSISASDGESIMREVLKDALAEAFGDDPPNGLIEVCRTGRPSEILLQEGASAQLLIVGSRGHGGFAGLLLGSVGSSCAAHASCPVLVVRPAVKGTASPGETPVDAAKRPDGEQEDGS